MTPALLSPTRYTVPIEDLTRREFMFSALGSALLIACGSGDESGPEGATFSIEDHFGPVTVPVDPQRIVAADSVTVASMLALNIKPVAAAFNRLTFPRYLIDQLEGVDDITDENGIDLERALSHDPDLIITSVGVTGYDVDEARYRNYQAVVPTYAYTHHYTYIEQIVGNLNHVARALRREEQAQQRIREYEDRVAALKARVEQAGLADKPVSTIRVFQDGRFSVRIGTSESIAFRALGIAQPEDQQNPDDFAITLSTEQLNVLNASYALFVYVDDTAATNLETNPVWQSLEPVQNGRIYPVDSGVWNSIDIVGLMRILDDIEAMLITPAEA